MNRILFIVIICFSCCTQKPNSKPNSNNRVQDSIISKNDSFNFRDLQQSPSLQKDIPLDSTYIPQSKMHMGIQIVTPRLLQKADQEVYQFLKKFVRETKNEFVESLDEPVYYDSSISLNQGYSMGIIPNSLYKDDQKVSVSMEVISGFSGMPSDVEYTMFNYDNKKGKKIRLEDFFILKTAVDTSWFASMVCKSLNWGKPADLIQYMRYIDRVKFSFDKENVYFFFDHYELFAGGQIGSVKKKYIVDHIMPEYR